MTIVQLIKEHFPEVQHKDRKKFIPMIEFQKEKTGKSYIELIKEARLKHLKKKEEEMPLFMRKMFATAFLIESNDELEGTSLHGYYCKITNESGRKFMNAQYSIYQKEFNQIATEKTKNTNDILKRIERCSKIIGRAVMYDQEAVCDSMELMQKDEIFAKRVNGLYKQHIKQYL